MNKGVTRGQHGVAQTVPPKTFQTFGNAIAVAGTWYFVSGVTHPGNNANGQSLAAGTMVVGTPHTVTEDITITQLGMWVTTGGAAGALMRFGLYTPINQAQPWEIALNKPYANLLVDGGTAAATSSGVRLTVTLPNPVFIPAGTAICGACATQGTGGAVTITSENVGTRLNGPWGQTTASQLWSGTPWQVQASSVTADLPPLFVPTAFGADVRGAAVWMFRNA